MSRNAPRREYFEKAKRDLDTSVYFDVNGLWTDTQGLSFNSSLYYITREGGYETQDIRLGKYLGRRGGARYASSTMSFKPRRWTMFTIGRRADGLRRKHGLLIDLKR